MRSGKESTIFLAWCWEGSWCKLSRGQGVLDVYILVQRVHISFPLAFIHGLMRHAKKKKTEIQREEGECADLA